MTLKENFYTILDQEVPGGAKEIGDRKLCFSRIVIVRAM